MKILYMFIDLPSGRLQGYIARSYYTGSDHTYSFKLTDSSKDAVTFETLTKEQIDSLIHGITRYYSIDTSRIINHIVLERYIFPESNSGLPIWAEYNSYSSFVNKHKLREYDEQWK